VDIHIEMFRGRRNLRERRACGSFLLQQRVCLFLLQLARSGRLRGPGLPAASAANAEKRHAEQEEDGRRLFAETLERITRKGALHVLRISIHLWRKAILPLLS
jgi:hypothetical protein